MSALTLRLALGQSNRRPLARVEYLREGAWHDLSERVLYPVSWQVAYKQLGSATLRFDNWDGLLSPHNEESPYNLNSEEEFDPLLDERRRIRIKAGVLAPQAVSEGASCTASRVALNKSSTACPELVDGTLGEAGSPFDGKWLLWQASEGTVSLTVDLAEETEIAALAVRCLANTANTFWLPSLVTWALSSDGTNWTTVKATAKAGYAADSTSASTGLFVAHDLEPAQARYARVTLTPGLPEGGGQALLGVDEIEVLGGQANQELVQPVFAGYLGDEIALDSEEGVITCQVRDLTKRLKENYLDVTAEYKRAKVETILESLLVNPWYWKDETPVGAGEYSLASTGFVMPEWQGQSGSLHDFISKLADTVGYVFEVDPAGNSGAGQYVLRKPKTEQDWADLTFHYGEWLQTSERKRTGLELRNHVRVEGPSGKSRPLSVDVRSTASIQRYGKRYFRIVEPLCKTEKLARALAEAVLRDYGWVHENIEAEVLGHPDLSQCNTLVAFAGEERTGIEPEELWRVRSAEHMLTATDWTCLIEARLHKPPSEAADPAPPIGLTAVAGSTQVGLSWTATSGVASPSYKVYKRQVGVGDFALHTTVETASTLVTGLTNGTAYEFTVSCVNGAVGGEGEVALPVKSTPLATGGLTTYAETQAKPTLSVKEKNYASGAPYSLLLQVTGGITSTHHAYNVYRSTLGASTGFELVATLFEPTSANAVYNEAAIRQDVVVGNSVWYRVACCNRGGSEGTLSDALQVTW